uniref:Uncharacterized protein n=1 Tax=Lepeophtheirus salmonis TaxID=72036 RepID=A0A0K2TL78_LEPSM
MMYITIYLTIFSFLLLTKF